MLFRTFVFWNLLPSIIESLASNKMPTISITDNFDGGNIQHVKTEGPIVRLNIKKDVYTELEKIHHYQYFCFRATISDLPKDEEKGSGAKGVSGFKKSTFTYVIDNAFDVSYPVAWKGSTVCYTDSITDTNSWKRKLDTHYTDGKLSWTHTHTQNGSVYFAYFPPYTYHQHLTLVNRCAKYANHFSLGKTIEGREIDCISVGNPSGMKCWIQARQHPGETMAEYYTEGLLTRLLGLDTNGEVDGMVRRVLDMYQFYIVPCMCLDGAVLGHLRTNSVGANLNREWASKGDYEAPTLERSPEVYYVLKKMDETGVDAFIDVHGDEELPFNFLSGAEMVPTWGPRLESLHGAFLASYVRANTDMQTTVGYPPADDPEQAKEYLNVATNQIATRFNCLAVTLEMPFKDCRSNPDPDRGWSPNRSRMLGASLLDALAYICPYLRVEGEFWHDLPLEDRYIAPTDDYVEDSQDGQDFKPLKRIYSDHYAKLKQKYNKE